MAPTECCPEIWVVRSAMQMELGFGAQDWVNAQKGMKERNRGGGEWELTYMQVRWKDVSPFSSGGCGGD